MKSDGDFNQYLKHQHLKKTQEKQHMKKIISASEEEAPTEDYLYVQIELVFYTKMSEK